LTPLSILVSDNKIINININGIITCNRCRWEGGLDAVFIRSFTVYKSARGVHRMLAKTQLVARVSDSLISSSVECRQRYLIRLIALHDMSAVERGVERAEIVGN